jgi:hypothetical protein
MNRQITEAQRELEKVKGKMHKTEWNRGYFRALYGMLLARKSNNNDSYSFFAKLNFNDKEAINVYRREFLNHVHNKLHADFDKGYFSAWADCMRVLTSITLNMPETKDAESGKEEAKPSEAEKSQTTMEGFIEESN